MTADPTLVLAILMAFAFALTNGFLDAANSIATLVATRIARPLPAVAMASVFNLLGPLFFGAAVANTVGKLVTVDPTHSVAGHRRRADRGGRVEHDRLAPEPAVELESRPGRRAGRGRHPRLRARAR